MKKLVCLSLLILGVQLQAQTVADFQNEINKTVWKPFQQAFESLDGEALNATYADEVLRVTPQGIDTQNSFKTANLKRFEQNKTDGVSIALDFWFDSRHTNGAASYEVGFYRIRFTDKSGKTNYNYGQFHIVIRKQKGEWKITQDWDTTIINGKTIDAEDFARNPILKF
ncbi:MAG: DUF4440 domain-containing protein [Bacteroidota bacterium]